MFKELRDMKPSSISMLILVLVASWVLTLSLGMTIVGAQAPEAEAGEQFSVMGGLQIALICLAVLLCIPPVVNVAIRRDSRRIALWQVIGASPRNARFRYVGIISISALAGAAVGALLAFSTWPAFGDAVTRTGLLALPALSEPLTPWAFTFGPGSAFLVVILALLLGAKKVRKVEPIEAVKELPEQKHSHGFARVLSSLLIVAGLIAGYVGIGSTKPVDNMDQIGGVASAYWGEGLGLLLAYGISDGVVIRPVVNLVGWIVPFGTLDSWVLARTSARRRATLSTAVITPLVVAAGTLGCIFGMVNQMKNIMLASGASEDDLQVSPASQIILIFGPPVIIAAFAGVISVFLTSEWRRHDIALLQTLGATTRAIRWSAVFECAIYFLSAVVISTVILGINALAMGRVLGQGPVPGTGPVWFGNETYCLLFAGFSLLAIAIVVPTVQETKTLNMAAIAR